MVSFCWKMIAGADEEGGTDSVKEVCGSELAKTLRPGAEGRLTSVLCRYQARVLFLLSPFEVIRMDKVLYIRYSARVHAEMSSTR